MKDKAFHLFRKQSIGILVLVFLGIIFLMFKGIFGGYSESAYASVEPVAQHANGSYFSGGTVCAECHMEIYTSHRETAHFKSSSEANSESVKGSFHPNKNRFQLNDTVAFQMNTRNNELYQDIFLTTNDSLVDSLRMDMVIGSGTKGQSYLSWEGNKLFQLQPSYFAPNQSWVNSPGYPPNQLVQDRPIFGRCLECHVTNAKSEQSFSQRNGFDRSQMVYGIDCERCHGPSLQHVDFHRKNPNKTSGMHIVKQIDLSRQQKLDACALCHSGIHGQSNSNAFAFMVGDTLRHYSSPDYNEESITDLDVHGNQYGLLSASKCFKNSNAMDCTTCHNPHKKERDQPLLFNNICMGCHSASDNLAGSLCTENSEVKLPVEDNCIQCHMPLVASKAMQIEVSKDSVRSVQVRTHFIGIYADSITQLKHKVVANQP